MAVRTGIAALSQMNAVPFVYGIRHADDIRADLVLSTPAGCAEKFLSGEVAAALVPVSVLPSLPKDAEIVTSWCIGTAGDSLLAVMKTGVPPSDIKTIRIPAADPGAAALARYIAAKYWNIRPAWEEYSPGDISNPAAGEALLLSGDDALWHRGGSRYEYDLTGLWKEMHEQPFAMYVWVARKELGAELLDALETALGNGVERTLEALLSYDDVEKDEQHIVEAYRYLTETTDYMFDNQKHKALKKFWDDGLKTSLRANPG